MPIAPAGHPTKPEGHRGEMPIAVTHRSPSLARRVAVTYWFCGYS